MFLSDKMDRDTDSSSEQLDGDNESSESELNTTSDDNDWCPVTIVDGDLIRYLNLPLSVQNPSHPQNILVVRKLAQNLELQSKAHASKLEKALLGKKGCFLFIRVFYFDMIVC